MKICVYAYFNYFSLAAEKICSQVCERKHRAVHIISYELRMVNFRADYFLEFLPLLQLLKPKHNISEADRFANESFAWRRKQFAFKTLCVGFSICKYGKRSCKCYWYFSRTTIVKKFVTIFCCIHFLNPLSTLKGFCF